eukprot:Protomagalhaensia_sp_Gyna_25__429@NODE_1201_length_2073_cov_2_535890_g956_i0_p3_GENE_NODE_1201_length_2073_cov_2_535890_g956_i0NODE_1201_length_2073_cov_2_535890_g956_i0_p3_ORF_typecomplete_len181_score41_27SUI1/PF01253_22/5_1e03SUI1/PF01253_22/2e08_NODE_1201_length_2073_cov_2_535890_g956_i0218760
MAALPSNSGDLFPELGQAEEVNAQLDPVPGEQQVLMAEPATLLTRDSRLLNVVLTKAERQTVKRFISNGMKVVTLLLENTASLEAALKDPALHGGLIEADAKIAVSTQRTKRFTRTRVAGIHMFPSIDPKQLADRLQKACAAAATVCELDEVKGKTKPLGVVVQGAVVQEVCDVLLLLGQ